MRREKIAFLVPQPLTRCHCLIGKIAPHDRQSHERAGLHAFGAGRKDPLNDLREWAKDRLDASRPLMFSTSQTPGVEVGSPMSLNRPAS